MAPGVLGLGVRSFGDPACAWPSPGPISPPFCARGGFRGGTDTQKGRCNVAGGGSRELRDLRTEVADLVENLLDMIKALEKRLARLEPRPSRSASRPHAKAAAKKASKPPAKKRK